LLLLLSGHQAPSKHRASTNNQASNAAANQEEQQEGAVLWFAPKTLFPEEL
jgi:hypothetical protein